MMTVEGICMAVNHRHETMIESDALFDSKLTCYALLSKSQTNRSRPAEIRRERVHVNVDALKPYFVRALIDSLGSRNQSIAGKLEIECAIRFYLCLVSAIVRCLRVRTVQAANDDVVSQQRRFRSECW